MSSFNSEITSGKAVFVPFLPLEATFRCFSPSREKKTRLFFNIARLLGTLALQRYGRREGGGVSFIDGVRKLDFSP